MIENKNLAGKISEIRQNEGMSKDQKNEVMISALINTSIYFFHWAFIRRESVGNKEKYRLVIIRKRAFRYEKDYESLRGAKIAFAKLTHHFNEEFRNSRLKRLIMKPEWTIFYPPDKGWMEGVMAEADVLESLDEYEYMDEGYFEEEYPDEENNE